MRLPASPTLISAAALTTFSLSVSGPSASAASASTPITRADIAPLPGVVQQYFSFMGVIGKPRLHAIRTRFTGRFRMGLKGEWQGCDGWTYISDQGGAYRFFEMHLKFMGWMPLVVHDVYQDGQGSLRARLFRLVTVANDKGPELNIGELVTYLNDAIMGAPDLLLGPQTTWQEVGANHFDVTLRDKGTTVTARVTLDERGAPTDFSTTDRFFIDTTQPDRPPVRTRWTTPVAGWTTVEGRSISLGGKAIWHFADGPFTYGELQLAPGGVEFNPPFEK